MVVVTRQDQGEEQVKIIFVAKGNVGKSSSFLAFGYGNIVCAKHSLADDMRLLIHANT